MIRTKKSFFRSGAEPIATSSGFCSLEKPDSDAIELFQLRKKLTRAEKRFFSHRQKATSGARGLFRSGKKTNSDAGRFLRLQKCRSNLRTPCSGIRNRNDVITSLIGFSETGESFGDDQRFCRHGESFMAGISVCFRCRKNGSTRLKASCED